MAKPDLAPAALAKRIDSLERLLRPGGQKRIDPAVLDKGKLFNLLQGSAGFETGTDDLGAGSVTTSKIATVPQARVYRNAASTHTANGAFQGVAFDTVAFDLGTSVAQWDAATNSFVCRTAGLYAAVGVVFFNANGAGRRLLALRKNGGQIHQTERTPSGVAGAGTSADAATLERFAVGDVLDVEAFQSSGGNLAYSVGSSATQYMAWTWLSP